MLVVPGDLCLEQEVGVLVVGDFFVSQEADEPFLKGVEAALDFAFGLGVWGDAVGDAQRGEGALELGMGVESVGRSAMAKERQAIGVEAGWRTVRFDGRAQVREMVPGGVAAHEGAGDDFAGMIIEGEDKHGIMVVGPPGVRRTVVLPEFADGDGLPAATGFGAAIWGGDLLREVLADVGGDRRTGAMEVEAAGQFVGQQGEIQGLAVRQELPEKVLSGGWPGCFVVAARRGRLEALAVLKPLVAQLIETRGTDHEPLGGSDGVQGAVIEGGENFPDVEVGDAVSELMFFIAPE